MTTNCGNFTKLSSTILCFKTGYLTNYITLYHQILRESREICVHKVHWLRWILDACDIQTLKKVKMSLLQIFWKCAAVTEFKICLLVCRVWQTLAAQTEVALVSSKLASTPLCRMRLPLPVGCHLLPFLVLLYILPSFWMLSHRSRVQPRLLASGLFIIEQVTAIIY